ncbi:MAG: hypothetical protein M1812_007667 [Candelaria pacifica]|nr:MAG: hypothetical protein M1812_007667 [Candelaria pacifica]
MSKLIVIVGITGTQGASVADVFLQESGWKVRGITRDPSKPSAKPLTDRGIELVKGNMDDQASLEAAFQGATAIYSITDFWQGMRSPKLQEEAAKTGKPINELCYEYEIEQGKNIARAAANVKGLEHFICSSLSDARKWSKGKYTWVWHFDSKAQVVYWIKDNLPDLAKKMSVLQVACYATNWQSGPATAPQKQPDGSYKMFLPCDPNTPVPLVQTRKDTGNFVRALTQVPPGKTLLGYGGEKISWSEFMRLFGEVNGVKASFESNTIADFENILPAAMGRELGEMFAYFTEFGYDGNDPEVISPKDIGVPCPTTSMKEYIKNEDWSSVL